MSPIPPPTDSTISRIWKAWEKHNSSRHRTHLGASRIGGECERQLWYEFRWAKRPTFDGRVLRLFETGRQAEERLADDLRSAGMTVYTKDPETGEQFQFSDLGGHFSGSMDGAAAGVIESPATWHVVEFKTHNDKSFTDLVKNGVEKSKPEHHAQMQVYMGWSEMTRAIYVALNKNTDDIYIERVRFDKREFERLRQKAKEIIFSTEPPARMAESPAFFKCKWCAFNSICHETGEVAEANCRTCKHSVALEDGSWACDLHEKILSTEDQEQGCADHQHREGMLPSATRVRDEFNGKVVVDEEEVPF